ncbi:hypothetical protein ACTMTJ_39270 [Phytohabitans sp. LJ34]|uniref:hypothetical protein n=1 Tax=Phytohabitans sp. LJ34 TaxID=3452217 RepID=UPI003F89ABD4
MLDRWAEIRELQDACFTVARRNTFRAAKDRSRFAGVPCGDEPYRQYDLDPPPANWMPVDGSG